MPPSTTFWHSLVVPCRGMVRRINSLAAITANGYIWENTETGHEMAEETANGKVLQERLSRSVGIE